MLLSTGFSFVNVTFGTAPPRGCGAFQCCQTSVKTDILASVYSVETLVSDTNADIKMTQWIHGDHLNEGGACRCDSRISASQWQSPSLNLRPSERRHAVRWSNFTAQMKEREQRGLLNDLDRTHFFRVFSGSSFCHTLMRRVTGWPQLAKRSANTIRWCHVASLVAVDAPNRDSSCLYIWKAIPVSTPPNPAYTVAALFSWSDKSAIWFGWNITCK